MTVREWQDEVELAVTLLQAHAKAHPDKLSGAFRSALHRLEDCLTGDGGRR